MNYSIIFLTFLLSTAVFAQQNIEPMVKYNVPILENATPTQCEAARNSDTGPVDIEGDSARGGFSGTSGPGVRSCTGCAVDSNKTCVCRTCYYYFN